MENKTAVDYLLDNIHLLHSTKWNDIIEQAKKMEKEQIVKSYNQSWHDRMNPYKTAEKYYNKTYKK